MRVKGKQSIWKIVPDISVQIAHLGSRHVHMVFCSDTTPRLTILFARLKQFYTTLPKGNPVSHACQKERGKTFSDTFFQPEGPNEKDYICFRGQLRKKQEQETSHANLMSHIHTANLGYGVQISREGELTHTQLDQFFPSTKFGLYFGWFNMIINKLLPFAFLEKIFIRWKARQEKLPLHIFMQYLPWHLHSVKGKTSCILSVV